MFISYKALYDIECFVKRHIDTHVIFGCLGPRMQPGGGKTSFLSVCKSCSKTPENTSCCSHRPQLLLLSTLWVPRTSNPKVGHSDNLIQKRFRAGFRAWNGAIEEIDPLKLWSGMFVVSIQVDRKNPPLPEGFLIYHVPSSRTVSKGTPLEVPGTYSLGWVLLLTVFDEGT